MYIYLLDNTIMNKFETIHVRPTNNLRTIATMPHSTFSINRFVSWTSGADTIRTDVYKLK